MQGWKLFTHALRMVTGNWREAIRIFWAPVLAFGAVVVWISSIFGDLIPDQFSETSAEVAAPAAGSIGLAILLFVVAIALLGWGIVAWHRFVLLEESPAGILPPFRFDRVMAYFGRGIILSFACMICALPLMLIAVPAVGSGSLVATLGVMFVISVAISVLMYRWIAILPAAALGEPLTMGEAFGATRGATGAIFVLMVVLMGVNYGAEYFGTLLRSIASPIATIWDIAFAAVFGLVNISVLTTFYGHYVQGRPID